MENLPNNISSKPDIFKDGFVREGYQEAELKEKERRLEEKEEEIR